jgi:hypothetical protein
MAKNYDIRSFLTPPRQAAAPLTNAPNEAAVCNSAGAAPLTIAPEEPKASNSTWQVAQNTMTPRRNQPVLTSDSADDDKANPHMTPLAIPRHRVIPDSDNDDDNARPANDISAMNGTNYNADSIVNVVDTSSDGLQEDEIWVQAAKPKPNPSPSVATCTAKSAHNKTTPRTQSQRQSLSTVKSAKSKPATRKRKKSGTTLKRKLQGEAEEATSEESEESCDESASDARAQYTSAILGVRNARHAKQQRRTRTTPCAVCAQFSAYLENFVQ